MTKNLAALAGMFLLPAVAFAQPVHGLYVVGDFGVNFAGSPQSQGDTTRIYTNPGPSGLAALGWGFGNGFRVELEGSDRSNHITGISTLRSAGDMAPLGNVQGNVQTYAILTNLVYDVPVHAFGLPLAPYIGAGLGYGWLNLGDTGGIGRTSIRIPNGDVLTGPDHVGFGSNGAFAYQFILGDALALPVPGLAATVEYRFFGMAGADVPVTRVISAGGYTGVSTVHDGFTTHDNEVLIGLRYRFAG